MTSATQAPPPPPSPERPSIGDLLAEEDFVRRLARKLLGDSHAAEDLVQETWVRALQSPPRHSASLRGWLARVVRNLAANTQTAIGRRPKTTELIDTYARSPSAADSLALGLLRGELASALGRLSEDQRDVILRRHFDELPPREIARMARIPVETVRTRYKRGMAHLRERLDREYGQTGSAWMLGLVGGLRMPSAPPVDPSAPTGSGSTGSGSAGTSAAGVGSSGGWAAGSLLRLAAFVAVPAIAAGVLWWAVATPGSETLGALDRTGELDGVEVAGLAGPLVPARVPAAGPRPVVRPAKLVLEVRERGTNNPVAGLTVHVASLSLPDEPVESVVTDRRGRASVAKLLPGTYRILPERGASIARTLADGEKAELRLVVPKLRELHGRVVDPNGEPVAGAEVFASLPNEPQHVRPVATTDADGRFALDGSDGRDAIDPCVWLCARAPDGRFADSEMRYLDDPGTRAAGQKGGERELTLSFRYLPAPLRGVVVDDKGRPLEGAEVRIALGLSSWSGTGVAGPTWPEVRLDGTLVLNAPMRETVTDEAGAFSFETLRDGNHSLWVSAEGRAPWQMDVMLVSERETFVEVELERGATVTGTLKTPAGHAAENAIVSVHSDLPDVTRMTTTDRRGRFRIEGLPAGEIDVHAWLVDEGEPIHASVKLDLKPGATATWEPLLVAGGAIAGVAVDARGKPLAGWTVAIEREDWIGGHGAKTIVAPRVAVREVSTDADGRFTLPGCDAGFYFVTLFDPEAEMRVPLAWQSGAVPDAEPIRLELGARPSSSLFGRVVTVDDIPVRKIEVLVDTLMLPQQLRLPVDDEGRFAMNGVPPGQFTLRAWGNGVPLQLAAGGKLKSGERRDLGEVRLERSSAIELLVRRKDGSAPESMRVRLFAESSKPLVASTSSPIVGFDFHDPGAVRIGPIPRGRYSLRAWTDDGEYTRLARFPLGPGRTKSLELELEPAVPREFVVHCPASPKRRGYLVISIKDPEGEQVDQRLLNYVGDSDKSLRMAFHLPPGKYGFEAKIDGRMRADIEFEHAPEPGEPIEVDLR